MIKLGSTKNPINTYWVLAFKLDRRKIANSKQLIRILFSWLKHTVLMKIFHYKCGTIKIPISPYYDDCFILGSNLQPWKNQDLFRWEKLNNDYSFHCECGSTKNPIFAFKAIACHVDMMITNFNVISWFSNHL